VGDFSWFWLPVLYLFAALPLVAGAQEVDFRFEVCHYVALAISWYVYDAIII
jgi:hypothetical protein